MADMVDSSRWCWGPTLPSGSVSASVKKKKKSQNSQVTFTDLVTDLDQLLVNWRLNPYKKKNVLMLFKSSSKVPTQVLKILSLYQFFKPTKDDTFHTIAS